MPLDTGAKPFASLHHQCFPQLCLVSPILQIRKLRHGNCNHSISFRSQFKSFFFFFCHTPCLCGILVPRPGIEPETPWIGSMESSPLDYQGSPINVYIYLKLSLHTCGLINNPYLFIRTSAHWGQGYLFCSQLYPQTRTTFGIQQVLICCLSDWCFDWVTQIVH